MKLKKKPTAFIVIRYIFTAQQANRAEKTDEKNKPNDVSLYKNTSQALVQGC